MAAIHKALAEIQAELKAPKGQTNTFGKYKYRSCEDILEALKPLLYKNGVALTISDSIEMVSDRIYVQATARIDLVAGDGAVEVTASAREAGAKKGMDDAQITGSASSYARKYALNGLFAIDDTKDADATNDHGKGGKDQPKKAEKVYVESNLPSWTERFDKLETAAERKQCYKDNEKTIFDELTKQEVANLQSYLVQLKEAEDKKGKLNINI